MPPSRLPAALALVLTLAFGALASAAGTELLRNGGFEEDKDKRPALWIANGPVGLGPAARSGTGAVRLGKGGRVLQCFALEAGRLYQSSVWARGKGTLALSFYEYTDGPGQGYASGVNSGPLAVGPEWRRFRLAYSQGANEQHLKGIAFALSGGGDGAQVLVDDASLMKIPLPAKPANLLSNPAFGDANGDGMPDGWRGERRRLRIETTRDGIRSVRCDATLFSGDYLPDASFRDWWSWARWGTQHGSGWPALPRPLGGAYTVLLESAPAPVEPGQRCDVRMLLREQDVYGEFIAVRWFDAARKPLAEFEERLGYHHQQGHTGDWVEYVGRTTSPQTARYAAVAVGAKLSSGAVWVARPSLTVGLGAPTRHKPRTDRQPAAIKQGPPKLAVTTPEPLRTAPPAKPGVEVTKEKIHVAFANGVALELPLRGKRLVGVTEVSCRGVLLRSPKAPPLAPVVQAEPSRNYSECIYEGWEKTRDGVVIHSTLRAPDGTRDRLDWLLAPTSRSLAGRAYVGLRYGYRVVCDKARVLRIMDRATWEAGGHSVGTHVGQLLHPVSRSCTYCLQCAYRFVGADLFDYQTSRAGTLVTTLGRYHTSLLLRAATPDFIILQDTFLFPEVSEAATTPKHVLFCPEPGGADDWARVRDELVAHYRRQLGAPPERPLEPVAMILGWGRFRGVGSVHMDAKKPTRPDYYRWVADKAVPALAKLGFKRVMIVLGMAPLNWPDRDIDSLRPEYAEPFKYLCDTARKHGMGVITWYGTAQNRDQSPVWAAHPDFVLMGADGKRARAYYSPWGWPGNLASGYFQFTLDRLKEMRDRTGLAGLWLDSYSNATHLSETARLRDAVRQADALLPWQAQVEKLGLYTYCEGHPTCLGTPSTSGWRPPADWSRFHPDRYYKCGLYFQQDYVKADMASFLADADLHPYYRFLANRCCPILDVGHLGTNEAAIARIARANHDFNAVSNLMEERHLLGERGVEWSSKRGRAVFAFEPFDYAVPQGLRLRDVTQGKDIPLPATRRVTLARYHTYRLTPQ